MKSSLRRPPNRAGQLPLEPRVGPRAREMAERVVVRAAAAERLRPGQWIVAGRSDGRRIEAQQHVHARPRVLAERVELLQDREPIAEAARRRMSLILDDDAGLLSPGMLPE